MTTNTDIDVTHSPLQAELSPDWEGTAEELVREISRLVGEAVPDKEFAPNVRLLRYYQSAGAVSRPERRKKQAYYGYRQLLEVLVVRALVLDGWPVEKIARITRAATDDELRAMLPLVSGPEPESAIGTDMNEAQALVAQFARETGAVYELPAASSVADAAEHSTSSEPARSKPRRYSVGESADWREVIELQLPYEARLAIDATRLRKLTPEQIRELARAVERSLRTSQRLQPKRR